MGAVIIIALKSLLECIRLQTLGRAGLQQLQLDCHYLRPSLQCAGAWEQQVSPISVWDAGFTSVAHGPSIVGAGDTCFPED